MLSVPSDSEFRGHVIIGLADAAGDVQCMDLSGTDCQLWVTPRQVKRYELQLATTRR